METKLCPKIEFKKLCPKTASNKLCPKIELNKPCVSKALKKTVGERSSIIFVYIFWGDAVDNEFVAASGEQEIKWQCRKEGVKSCLLFVYGELVTRE